MYYYRLVVSYKGTNYFGWQDLGVNEVKPTVEGTIYQVLQKICKHQECTISTASRTDAGVLAQGQVIKISIALNIEPEKLLLGMNSLLSNDIRILQCRVCSEKFNPNTESKNKEYHYYFSTDMISNPVLDDVISHIPSTSKNPLDIKLMQEACALFIGEHDFYSFAKRDVKMRSTVRTIVKCEIIQAHSSVFSNQVYYLKIVGEGSLRYMVRYIMGALFSLGRNELSLNDISEALIHHKEDKISSRAKSRGLHLIQVSY